MSSQDVGTDFKFKGTTTTISNTNLYDADKPVYILQSDGNWHKVPQGQADAYVGSFRAYLQADAANAANVLVTMLDAIDLSDLADNSTLLASYDGQTVSVTLRDRTLYKDDDWNTLCLPFSLTAEQIAASPLARADIRALTSASFNDGALTLNFTPPIGDDPDHPAEGAVTSITAGTPYLIKWDSAQENIVSPVFNGVTISNTTNNKVIDFGDGNSITFAGTYGGYTYTKSNKSVLFLGTSNVLYYPEVGAIIGAQRAYFQLNSNHSNQAGIRTFVLNFGDGSEQTSIVTTDFKDVNHGAWFTLDGRKLSGKPTAKGVYINNDTKIVIK